MKLLLSVAALACVTLASAKVVAKDLNIKLEQHSVHGVSGFVSDLGLSELPDSLWGVHHEPALRKVKTDGNMNSYYHYKQRYRGIVVEHSSIVVEVANDGTLKNLVAELPEGMELDTTPSLDSSGALEGFRAQQPSFKTYSDSELVIFEDPAASRFLTYKVRGSYTDEQTQEWVFGDFYLDAHTADVRHVTTAIHSAKNREVYQFPDSCYTSDVQLIYHLTSNQVAYEGINPIPEEAYDSYVNSGNVYDFYDFEFGRDSIDDAGMTLKSTVECQTYEPSYGYCVGDNAFWLDDPYNQMVYLVDGAYLYNLDGCLDVVGHEFTHGLISYTSNLAYEFESGAINEGLADAMGAAVHAWVTSGGSSSGSPATVEASLSSNDHSYWIGQGCYSIDTALRYMDTPTRDGQSRDNYNNIDTCPDLNNCPDYGYVHTNSGIFNMVFYLLAEGGNHPTSGENCNLEGLGIQKAYRIAYHANKDRFTDRTTFEQMRYHMANEAADIYGSNSAEYRRVHEACDCVNIPGFLGGTAGDDSGDSHEEEVDGGEVAGAVVGTLVGVGAVGAAVFFVVQRRQRTPRNPQFQQPLASNQASSAPVSTLPFRPQTQMQPGQPQVNSGYPAQTPTHA